MGSRDEPNVSGRYEHMFEGKKKRGFMKNNRDPFKEEIKSSSSLSSHKYPIERKDIDRKDINVVIMNHGDVDRRMNCW